MFRTWVACALLIGLGCAGCSGKLSEQRVKASLRGCLGPEWSILKVGPMVFDRQGDEMKTAFSFRIGSGQGVDATISIPGRAEYRRGDGGEWYLTLVTSESHDALMRGACAVPFEVE